MELNKDDADKIAQQLQDAHRYAAGFYQRWIALINHVTGNFGFDFKFWKSLRYSAPPQSKTNPNQKWVWDFLPLCHSRFVYARAGESSAVLEIYFKPDPSLDENGWPNPFALKIANPTVELHVFSSKNKEENIFELWGDEQVVNPKKDGVIQNYDNGLQGLRHSLALGDFLMQPENCIRDILQEIRLPTK